MSDKVWVEIQVETGATTHPYVGQVAAPIEQSILAAGPEEFVQLENVRWFDNKDAATPPTVTRQEELEEGFASFAWFKRRHIVIVTPIRDDVTVWRDAARATAPGR